MVMEVAPAAAVNNTRKHRRAAKNCWNNHLPGDEDGKQGSTGGLSKTGPAPKHQDGQ